MHLQNLAGTIYLFYFSLLTLIILPVITNGIYYLKLLDIKISASDSKSIFFSGLAMSATPGKLGELLKSYLLKKITDVPVSKSAPVIFA